MPAATAQFTVGDALKPDLLLPLDQPGHFVVLDTAKLSGRHLLGFDLLARLQDPLRP